MGGIPAFRALHELRAGGVETHDFVSLYALHVLLEAGDRGEAVPADLLATTN